MRRICIGIAIVVVLLSMACITNTPSTEGTVTEGPLRLHSPWPGTPYPCPAPEEWGRSLREGFVPPPCTLFEVPRDLIAPGGVLVADGTPMVFVGYTDDPLAALLSFTSDYNHCPAGDFIWYRLDNRVAEEQWRKIQEDLLTASGVDRLRDPREDAGAVTRYGSACLLTSG